MTDCLIFHLTGVCKMVDTFGSAPGHNYIFFLENHPALANLSFTTVYDNRGKILSESTAPEAKGQKRTFQQAMSPTASHSAEFSSVPSSSATSISPPLYFSTSGCGSSSSSLSSSQCSWQSSLNKL